ncbi:MAG: hypothetical protein IJ007_03175 [Oscillospiraceae bacterium]|nr:hypothetical protein [Oscillospiraceae bacterium]
MKKEYTLNEDGFRAVWYEGSTFRDKVIIYLGIAKTSEENALQAAQYLIDSGYSVLCLGFYLWDGLPKEMYRIPVEYVEKAVTELKANGFEKIAIHGISTGAGYALLCSSLIPDISCTIAPVPYDYVMEGMKNDLFPLGFAVYSYRGKSVAYSKYTCLNKGFFNAVVNFFKCKKQRGYKMAHIMRYAYDTSDENEASRIKVENMKSDLLIMAPEWDDCWPSEKAVPRIERILKENNYPYRVKAIIYPKASHALGGHFSEDTIKRANKIMPAEKNYPEECARARADSVNQILDFLKEW